MFGSSGRAALQSYRLPNGMDVASLGGDDTLMVYRDIFEDDCYRRGGVAILEGDCIVDVGANTGLFVLYLNQIVNDAQVYAFEPVPETFGALRRNIEMHDHLATRSFNLGLSDRPGHAEFDHYPRLSNASTMYPDDSARGARLGRDYVLGRFRALPRPMAALFAMCPSAMREAIAEGVRRHFLKKRVVTCELTTLSDVLREHGITRVDLLKVDAEQSEQHILAGLDDEDWPKIRQVIVEVHGGEDATRGMVETLRHRGFLTAVEPNPTFPLLSLVYGTRRP